MFIYVQHHGTYGHLSMSCKHKSTTGRTKNRHVQTPAQTAPPGTVSPNHFTWRVFVPWRATERKHSDSITKVSGCANELRTFSLWGDLPKPLGHHAALSFHLYLFEAELLWWCSLSYLSSLTSVKKTEEPLCSWQRKRMPEDTRKIKGKRRGCQLRLH